MTVDGSLLVLPTGMYRDPLNDKPNAAAPFCTYVYARSNWTHPLLCLAGLEEPSVAVRCHPFLFRMMEYDKEFQSNSSSKGVQQQYQPLIPGNYR